MLKVIDLCSGLGGFSEAFIQAGDDVLRVENNILLKDTSATILMTVQGFRDFLFQLVEDGSPLPVIDVIVASPPCLGFSNGYAAPQSKARRAGVEYTPSLEILTTCIQIIELLRPRYWIIENVSGAIKWFEPLLGEYSQKVGSFFLWGNMPQINMPSGWKHSKMKGDVWSSNPLRANIRGFIPFQVSSSLRGAIISQRSIYEYC